jgi:uncharacterized protein (UPF0303 family)
MSAMDKGQELASVTEQERLLRFRRFDLATAWELGTALKAAAEARGVAVAIEVRLLRETVFYCAMPGTTPENGDWIRRKRNTVELLQRSSYSLWLSLAQEGLTLEQKMGLPLRDYAFHGGCVPICVDEVGCVGTATVSGLPQREDHELVVAVMASLCERPLGALGSN